MSNPHTGALESTLGNAAKISPPATVLGAEFIGMHVADWVQWLTLLYLLLLVIHKVWSMLVEAHAYWRSRS